MKKKLEEILFKDGVFNWEGAFKAFVIFVVIVLLGFICFEVIPKFMELYS